MSSRGKRKKGAQVEGGEEAQSREKEVAPSGKRKKVGLKEKEVATGNAPSLALLSKKLDWIEKQQVKLLYTIEQMNEDLKEFHKSVMDNFKQLSEMIASWVAASNRHLARSTPCIIPSRIKPSRQMTSFPLELMIPDYHL